MAYDRRYSRRKDNSYLILAVPLLFLYFYKGEKGYPIKTVELLSVIGLCLLLSSWLLKMGIRAYRKEKERKLYLRSRISAIDHMSGEAFERLLKAHFEQLGYRAALTPKTNDYGADLVLQKGGVKTIVQAKRYQGKIGNKAVQEIVAAKGHYRATSCMVVTNSYFTANARQLAADNNVILWDRKTLIQNFQIKE